MKDVTHPAYEFYHMLCDLREMNTRRAALLIPLLHEGSIVCKNAIQGSNILRVGYFFTFMDNGQTRLGRSHGIIRAKNGLGEEAIFAQCLTCNLARSMETWVNPDSVLTTYSKEEMRSDVVKLFKALEP